MSFPFNRIVGVGLVVVVGLLTANGVISYRNTKVLDEDARSVAHALQTLGVLDDCFSTIKEIETGQRGYLLTGQEDYLRDYEVALRTIEGKLRNLENLFSEQPTQLQRLSRFREVADSNLRETIKTVALYREGAHDEALRVVKSTVGLGLMQDLRSLTTEMRAEEINRLRIREIEHDHAFRLATLSGLAATIAGIGAVLGYFWLLRLQAKEREQTAARLHERKELLQATLASIGDGVIATDAQGCVSFLNLVAERLTEWSQTEAEGQPVEEVFRIVNEETREIAENPAIQSIREANLVSRANHTILLGKHGTEWPLDDSAAPILDADGKVRGAVLVFRETSELRRNQAALEDASRRKDEFLATLAHELRNPLAPIRNGLELLSMPNIDPEIAVKAREMMNRQLVLMIRLVDDLLDVSRITRGKISLRREPVEISRVVALAVDTSRPLIDSLKHDLTIDLPSETILVFGDLTRLSQVVSNLLNNAAKYTPERGKIQIKAEVNGQAIIRVRDSGIGIPPEMFGEIFEMFAQVDRSISRSRGGLGVGLTLVKRLIAMHEGTVEVQSEGPGQGSEFIIRLPLALEPVSPNAPNEGRDAS